MSRIVFLLIWLLAVVVVFAVQRDTLRRDYGVQYHPVRARAIVTDKDCDNHARLSYQYEVSGQTFRSVDSFGSQCEVVEPGAQVEIVYDQQRPEWSRHSVAQGDFAWSLTFTFLFAVLAGNGAAMFVRSIAARFWPALA